MIRVVLLLAALAAVPFVVYGLYMVLRRQPVGGTEEAPMPVLRLGAAGLALVVVGFVAILVTQQEGGAGGGSYEPARYENGKLIPGGFTEE